MATKTVLKRLLSKYGMLSIEMNTAMINDQAIITENAKDDQSEVQPEISYADSPFENVEQTIIDVETKQ